MLVGYDATKVFDGRTYTGMPVGGAHDWGYPEGRWRERKVAPDRWDFSFRATKRRRTSAPAGSGAPEGTMFHWYVLAHQRVRKLDSNSYQTVMEGTKWKLAHRRPAWRKWSSEYGHEPTARRKLILLLRETLAGLEAEERRGAQRLEMLLDPTILAEPNRLLDEWDTGALEAGELDEPVE